MDDTENILLPILVKRCCRLIDHRIDFLLKQHGIARSQFRVLHHVAKRGELTQKELVDILEVQGATLTPIVNNLVQKKWLVRVSNSDDMRVKNLRLTPEGNERLKDIPNPAEELNAMLISRLSKKQTQDLNILLRKVINELN